MSTLTVPSSIDFTSDASAKLRAWVASEVRDGDKIQLRGIYRSDHVLDFNERKGVSILSGGGFRRVTPSTDKDPSVLCFRGCEDVSVGEIEIDGGYHQAGLGSYDVKRGGHHGIEFLGTVDYEVENVHIHHVGGDFIYQNVWRVPHTTPQEIRWCEHGHIGGPRLNLHHSGRHGISFLGCRCVIVDSYGDETWGYIGDTGYATFEFEPNKTAHNGAEYIYIESLRVGPGQGLLFAAEGTGPVNELHFKNLLCDRRLSGWFRDRDGARRHGLSIENVLSTVKSSDPKFAFFLIEHYDDARVIANRQYAARRTVNGVLSKVMFMVRWLDCTDNVAEGNDLGIDGAGDEFEMV